MKIVLKHNNAVAQKNVLTISYLLLTKGLIIKKNKRDLTKHNKQNKMATDPLNLKLNTEDH